MPPVQGAVIPFYVVFAAGCCIVAGVLTYRLVEVPLVAPRASPGSADEPEPASASTGKRDWRSEAADRSGAPRQMIMARMP